MRMFVLNYLWVPEIEYILYVAHFSASGVQSNIDRPRSLLKMCTKLLKRDMSDVLVVLPWVFCLDVIG